MFASKLEPTQFKEPLPPTPLVYTLMSTFKAERCEKKNGGKKVVVNLRQAGKPALRGLACKSTTSYPGHHLTQPPLPQPPPHVHVSQRTQEPPSHMHCMYISLHPSLPHMINLANMCAGVLFTYSSVQYLFSLVLEHPDTSAINYPPHKCRYKMAKDLGAW